MYCQNCNKEIERENAKFCPVCGGQLVDKTALTDYKLNTKEDINDSTQNIQANHCDYISDKVIDDFVVKNTERYRKKFRKFQNGKKISFNTAALLVTPLWLIYRRLYKLLVIYIVVAIFFGSTLNFIMSIVFCLFGDWFYYNKFIKNYEKNNGKITLKPGVNSFAYWLVVIFFILVVLSLIIANA